MGADVQAADEAGELITGRFLVANFLAVLPLIEQAARRETRKTQRELRAENIAAKYKTTIDKAWTIMILGDLRKKQEAVEYRQQREAHYAAWKAWKRKCMKTVEGRQKLIRKVHWSDIVWSGDEIVYIHVEYPGYPGE